MNLSKKLSDVKKSKAYAMLTAFALAVLVPGAAFAADTLETDAVAAINSLKGTVTAIGVALLVVVGAIVAVNVVMRMMKKA